MNLTNKILLTIHLEGGALVRTSKPIFISYKKENHTYNSTTKKWTKKTDSYEEGVVKHFPLESKSCFLKTTISKYSYDYMVSDELPVFLHRSKSSFWKTLREDERLKIHLNRICHHHRGKFFTYELLED